MRTSAELARPSVTPKSIVSGWSLALIVSTFVAVLGVFAFGSLVLKY